MEDVWELECIGLNSKSCLFVLYFTNRWLLFEWNILYATNNVTCYAGNNNLQRNLRRRANDENTLSVLRWNPLVVHYKFFFSEKEKKSLKANIHANIKPTDVWKTRIWKPAKPLSAVVGLTFAKKAPSIRLHFEYPASLTFLTAKHWHCKKNLSNVEKCIYYQIQKKLQPKNRFDKSGILSDRAKVQQYVQGKVGREA